MQRLSSTVSRQLVFAVGAASVAGCVVLLYARHVVGNPMRLFRDGEGVLRFETRRDVLERKAAVRAWRAGARARITPAHFFQSTIPNFCPPLQEARLALAAEPDSAPRRYSASLAEHALALERARLTAAGAAPDITDDDLQ